MKVGSFLLKVIVGIALCLVIGPIVVVLVVSFSAGTSISFPPPGFSFRWFAAFFSMEAPVTLGLFVAHIVVCLPYAFRAVLTSMQSFDTTLEEAGQSLGASPLKAFLRVTLPIIWPGVLSGWLFAFVVSFGELNAALFLTGPGVVTLPIEIFNYLQFQGNQLVVAAASALQVLIIALILIVAQQVIGAKQIVQR